MFLIDLNGIFFEKDHIRRQKLHVMQKETETKLHNGGRITHFGHPTEPQIQKQSSKDHNLVSDNEKGGFQLVLYHTQPGIIEFF